MRLREPIVGGITGAAFGALITLGVGAKLFPPATAYLTVPGIALLWGNLNPYLDSWWGVVIANGIIYALAGIVLGSIVALVRHRAKRASAA